MNVPRTIGTSFTTAGSVNDAGANSLTMGGLVQLNAGGSFNDAPTYSSGSTLVYNTGGSTGIANEWTGGTSEPGVPYNVTIQNNTSVTFDGNRSSTALTAKGNVSIGSGSSLTLGSSPGGDLSVAGNWSKSGTFNPNGRGVTFDGSSAQSLTGATAFDNLTLNNDAGLSLDNDATVSGVLTFSAGKITTGANKVVLAAGASTSGAGAGKYVFGREQKHVGVSGGSGSGTLDVGDAS